MNQQTQIKFHRHSILNTIIFALCMLMSSMSFGALLNGDFSAGFNGWSGEIIDDSYNTFYVDPATQSDNYESVLGNATIGTNDNAPAIWSVLLFQDFAIDSIAVGSTLELSLSLTYSLTDLGDFTFAQLRDLDGALPFVDLLAGGTFDVTDWAGAANVTLEFGVQDIDLIYPDTMIISNITFTETLAEPVPAPAPILLIALGIIPLLRKRFNQH